MPACKTCKTGAAQWELIDGNCHECNVELLKKCQAELEEAKAKLQPQNPGYVVYFDQGAEH